MNDARSFATLLAQGGHYVDPETGAIVPPIHTATTYARDENYELIGYGYSRRDNPTYAQVENVLAELEGAAEALVFASGLAGIATFLRPRVSVTMSLPRISCITERVIGSVGLKNDTVSMSHFSRRPHQVL